MLSMKHYIQLVAIILLLSFMFLYLNVNSRMEISEDSRNLSLQIPENIDGDSGTDKKISYYVVFGGGDETEQSIYKNVCLFMDKMKLSYAVKQYVVEGDLMPDTGLIFCNTAVGEGISADILGSFISKGGSALFAAGIPEGYTDAYLLPIWGIVEKGNRVESKEWNIKGSFLPAEEMKVIYPGFQASTKVKLDKEVTVYAEDEEQGIPVVYGRDYGEGSILMVNGTLMQSRYSGGIFAAALGVLEEELLYPVIGATCVFLDDYPFILPGYDKNCVNLYGRSMESFERDMLWPVFVSYALSDGIRYTMNLCEKQEEYEEGILNEKLLTYLVKENLRYNGEVMVSKYYEAEGTVKNEFENIFTQHFPNYKIQAFAALGGSLPDGQVIIERGSYVGDGRKIKDQDFSWNGSKADFPVMTSGYSFEENAYRYLAGIGLYGVVSHSIPVEEWITAQSAEKSYETAKKELGSLLGRYGSDGKWLEGATVTEAAQRLIAYEQLDAHIRYEGERMEVSLRNYTEGQKFLLRTTRKIETVIGGKAYRINENYYCIEAEDANLTIVYKKGF